MTSSLKRAVGNKIKGIRDSKNIPAEEVAERSGLDLNFYLSVEDDKEIPTIGDLIKIVRVLGIRLGTLLDDCFDEGPVVHKAEDREWEPVVRNHGSEVSKVSYYSLSARKANRHMETYSLEISPSTDGNKKFSNHEGEEFLYVLEGEVELLYGKESFILKQGDSIYYDSIVPHHIGSASADGVARLLAVVYVPV